MDTRKPSARLERFSVSRTVKLRESEDREYQRAAVNADMDFSSYLRLCLKRGHIMQQAESRMRQTAG